jgi:F-type H+-transporting ATPase subunit delta
MVLATKILQAKRYAQAIFEIAQERKETDKWQIDLQRAAALTGNPEFVAVMDNPRFSFEDKAKLLSRQIGDINPLVLNLAYLLITRGKFSLLSGVSSEYQQLLDSHRGIEKAEVTTAVPLDEGDKPLLTKRLEALSGKKIIMALNVDPKIIGGIIIRIGGKLIDGSTISRLAALNEELASAGG